MGPGHDGRTSENILHFNNAPGLTAAVSPVRCVGQVGQVDVVVPHAPQARQDLSKRSYDEVIAMPANQSLIIARIKNSTLINPMYFKAIIIHRKLVNIKVRLRRFDVIEPHDPHYLLGNIVKVRRQKC